MTVCGYNSTMGIGIKTLFQGMYEAIAAKCDEEGLSFEAILRRETLEIPEINKALTKGHDVSMGLFFGLNVMALRLFRELLDLHERQNLPLTHDAFMELVDAFVSTLEHVEEFNLSIAPAKPQSDAAIQERAAHIASWIEGTYCVQAR